MIKHKVTIPEEDDFISCLRRSVEDDFKAMGKVGFYIDFKEYPDKLEVRVYGERSLKTKIDEFVKHLNDHYINGGG